MQRHPFVAALRKQGVAFLRPRPDASSLYVVEQIADLNVAGCSITLSSQQYRQSGREIQFSRCALLLQDEKRTETSRPIRRYSFGRQWGIVDSERRRPGRSPLRPADKGDEVPGAPSFKTGKARVGLPEFMYVIGKPFGVLGGVLGLAAFLISGSPGAAAESGCRLPMGPAERPFIT